MMVTGLRLTHLLPVMWGRWPEGAEGVGPNVGDSVMCDRTLTRHLGEVPEAEGVGPNDGDGVMSNRTYAHHLGEVAR